ncbi:uncharacterized protein LOC143340565 isoform X1 [Colletes latitarsis]|uniref:uncharacterized protein LOC143340565 isoform X1 n=2 Tax=Colletes latitarsis TaxID=2605962 RepID=UPI00403539B9
MFSIMNMYCCFTNQTHRYSYYNTMLYIVSCFTLDTMSKRNKLPSSRICCFCGLSEDNELEFGKFYKHGDIVTHYYCLLLSSNMEQKGRDNEGILGFLASDIRKELRRGKRLVCSYCKKNGATLGCCNTKCKRIFHYPCGLRAGTLNQFFGEFRSFCKHHRPKQKIDPQIKNELANTSDTKCYICYDSVNSGDIVNTIWAPCCKKNAWFHRKCVQQLAVSAGYFFKCPLCNDKITFQKAMLEFGIFVPSQDASWELEPNAFQELLHRHDRCDAPICLCPKGRKYTSFNAKWELALCRNCGSQGIHMACGQLKWANPVWECLDCISILGKSMETTNSNSTGSTLQNDSDSEDSESDISVGKESPVPLTSNVPVPSSTSYMSTMKQRPGPQTFKIKQQLKAARELQMMQLSNSSKQGTSVKKGTMLNFMHPEESTSTKETSMTKSELLKNEVFHKCSQPVNLLTEYSKSLSATSSDNVIMLDSDDDVIEIVNDNTLDDTLIIPSVNGTETKNLSSSKNNTTEVKENCIIRNYGLLTVGKLVQENNLKQNYDNNFLTSNLNVTADVSKEHVLQGVVKSDILDETIQLNQETEHKSIDIFSKIKITNVMSLTPEEFENVSPAVEEQKNNNIECSRSENSNELLNNNSVSQSLLSQSDCLVSRLKRKFDYTVMNPTTSPEEVSKKIRRDLNTHKEEQQSLVFKNTINTESSVASVNNVSTSTFAKNDLQIDNNKKNETSAAVSNIINGDRSHMQIIQSCDTNNYAVNEHTYNTEHSMVGKGISCDVSAIPTNSSEYKKKVKNNVTNACNEYADKTNAIPKNRKIEKYPRNCDGDAGTSPAAKSGYKSFTKATRIDTEECIKLDHFQSQSDKSHRSDQRKSENDTEMATISIHRTSNATYNDVFYERRNRNTEYNYSRLIPEYVRLRDLKFRVYNTNNLQMTLYNKFSVNINMENTTNTKKNTKFDASIRKAVQQKVFKMQGETSSNFKSEDVLHRLSPVCNKDKSKYGALINDQSENYRDDAKENLDPIIAPCKSITDELVTSTTLITNNSIISTNSNNQSQDGNSTHFAYNASKVIEEDNKWRNRENLVNNVNMVDNAESTFDVEEHINVTSYATTHSTEKYFRNSSDIMQNIQSLNTDHITSSIAGKRSVKVGIRNDSFDSTKLVQHTLCFEDHINCKTENKTRNMIETCFKISIDLKKIKNFIDDNPDLFFTCKKESDERCLEEVDRLKGRNDIAERINISTKHVKHSAIDESNRFENLTLSLPINKVVELKNQTNEDNKKIEDTITIENVLQGSRRSKSSSFNNQKRDLQRCHLEKQYILNR